jgi:hypothetical protein
VIYLLVASLCHGGVCTDIYSREPQGLYSCQMQAAAFDAAVGYPVASCRREWAEI